jgi:GT2 family glycosyltransferase
MYRRKRSAPKIYNRLKRNAMIGVIGLCYGDRGEGNIEENLSRAGHEYWLFKVNTKGVAAALNEGLLKARYCESVVTLANDIRMPDNWLAKMVEYANLIPNSGMIGIHTVEHDGTPKEINGITVNWIYTPFGNVLITRRAIERIGFFNTEHDPYGMQDADYATRLNIAGFENYYIPGLKAEHTGHDVGSGTEYRNMKDEGLSKAGETYGKWKAIYESGKLYIGYGQE